MTNIDILTDILFNLQRFNQLNDRIIVALTQSFKIDAQAIYSEYGIVYWIKDNPVPH